MQGGLRGCRPQLDGDVVTNLEEVKVEASQAADFQKRTRCEK